MKVIDLLNKIANDDGIPMKILFRGFSYWYDKEEKDYFNFIGKDFSIGSRRYLLKSYFTSDMLNEKIDIIDNILEEKEEKKIPEKFKINYEIDEDNTINMFKASLLECEFANKVNEIIDYLKNKGDE